MHRTLNFSAFVESDGRLGTVAHSTVRLCEATAFSVYVEAVVTWRRGRSDRRQLDVAGRARLPEMRANVRFSRGVVRNYVTQEEQRTSVALVHAGAGFAVPAQSLDTAQPESADLWVLTPEPSREPPWIERFAGNFRDRRVALKGHVPVVATLDASIWTEAHGRGALVDISGELRFDDGLRVRLLVRDPEHPFAHPTESEGGEVVLIEPGARIPIPRQRVSGRVGANPWIALGIEDQNGSTLIPERALGRSVRIA